MDAEDAALASAPRRADRRARRRLLRARFRHLFLGRPRGAAAAAARRSTASRSPQWARSRSLSARRRVPGRDDRPAEPGRCRPPTGAAMPCSQAWLAGVAPIAASRSSYNGLLVFVFIVASASLAAPSSIGSPRTRCGARRRGIAAFPTRAPDPIQRAELQPADPSRVRRLGVSRARNVDMPAPGELAPARLRRDLRDLVWDTLYEPLGRGRRRGRGAA